jgi:hypothetical protein
MTPALGIRDAGISRGWLIRVIAAAALAFIIKTSLAWNTYGTNDVLTWEQDLAKLHADGSTALYRDGIQFSGGPLTLQAFVHPPFMIHLLGFWDLLASVSHIPVRFWMRFTCALADVGSLIVVCKLHRRLPDPFQPALLVLFALCPVSILISGFHGNTDPLMIFLLLLSIYTLEGRNRPFLSGAVMGLALSIKIVPLIVVPAFLLYLGRNRDRVQFLTPLCGVWLLSGVPYILLDPRLVVHKLTAYGSVAKFWGLSRITLLLANDSSLRWVYESYYSYGKLALVIGLIVLSVGIKRSQARMTLFSQCGLIVSSFLFFTPGFGVQYLSWLAPWIVSLAPSAAAGYCLTGGVLLFVLYTEWSGGFPWYLADGIRAQGWSGTVVYLGLACWLVIGVILFLYTDRWLKQPRFVNEPRPSGAFSAVDG